MKLYHCYKHIIGRVASKKLYNRGAVDLTLARPVWIDPYVHYIYTRTYRHAYIHKKDEKTLSISTFNL